MNLDPRAIALQGIGFAPTLVALQGFRAVEDVVTARRGRRNARFEPYRGEPTADIQLLHQEDGLVTDLILTLVTKGFFDGTTLN